MLAPCAIAGVASADSIPRLGCRILAGAANDTLADDGCAELLAQRGIVYVPDFVANAGGVIQIHALREALSNEELHAEITQIGNRVAGLLGEAEAVGSTPLAIAERRAEALIAVAPVYTT